MQRSVFFKLFAMMFLEFFIWGAWLPLIFGYLPALGFSAWQQSLILNAFPAAAILGMFFSNQFADRNFAAEKFLAVSHLIGGRCSILALAWVHDFWTFFALMLVHCVVYVPTISITNSIAFAAMKDAQREFGIVRMGGTIGWIAAAWPPIFLLVDWKKVNELDPKSTIDWLGAVFGSPLTGDAMQHATAQTYVVAGIASLVLAVFSLTLPHTPARPATNSAEGLAWLESMKLLVKPFVLVLWIVTLVDAFVHNCYFNWTGRFLPTVGIPGNWITPVMSIGQIAEILTMAILGTCLKKLGWRWTMVVGILGHAGRFAVFAYFGDESYKWLIVTVNILHGICYAFFFATVYIFVDEHFPKDARTSAQGLFNLMILGIGSLVANFACPPLFDALTEVVTATKVKASDTNPTRSNRSKSICRRKKVRFELPIGKHTTGKIPNDASDDKLQSILESVEGIGEGNVKVTGGSLPKDTLNIEFTSDRSRSMMSIKSAVGRVRFRDLFQIPCLAALLAAMALALFFHPPKIASSAEHATSLTT